MVIEIVFTNIIESCGHSNLKKMSYNALCCTVRLWVKQGFKMSNKMKSIEVTLTLLKVLVNPFTGPMLVKGEVQKSNQTITNFIWHKNGLIPVIQIDFSPFCSPVLFDFTLSAPLMASQIARWTFLCQYILSLMIWIPYKTNMPTWLPLSSSKGSSLWLVLIVVYQGIPLFRRIWKTPSRTKPHFEGSRLGPSSF